MEHPKNEKDEPTTNTPSPQLEVEKTQTNYLTSQNTNTMSHSNPASSATNPALINQNGQKNLQNVPSAIFAQNTQIPSIPNETPNYKTDSKPLSPQFVPFSPSPNFSGTQKNFLSSVEPHIPQDHPNSPNESSKLHNQPESWTSNLSQTSNIKANSPNSNRFSKSEQDHAQPHNTVQPNALQNSSATFTGPANLQSLNPNPENNSNPNLLKSIDFMQPQVFSNPQNNLQPIHQSLYPKITTNSDQLSNSTNFPNYGQSNQFAPQNIPQLNLQFISSLLNPTNSNQTTSSANFLNSSHFPSNSLLTSSSMSNFGLSSQLMYPQISTTTTSNQIPKAKNNLMNSQQGTVSNESQTKLNKQQRVDLQLSPLQNGILKLWLSRKLMQLK